MFVEREGMVWPLGPHEGQMVRFFEGVGPFRISQWGAEWRVRDVRKANERGGPDRGVKFASRNDAERHIQEQMGG